jgi:hypothetical protein
MNVLWHMIKIALGSLDAGVAEMLLQPVDVAPSLKPTNRKGVPEVVDAEPRKI